MNDHASELFGSVQNPSHAPRISRNMSTATSQVRHCAPPVDVLEPTDVEVDVLDPVEVEVDVLDPVEVEVDDGSVGTCCCCIAPPSPPVGWGRSPTCPPCPLSSDVLDAGPNSEFTDDASHADTAKHPSTNSQRPCLAMTYAYHHYWRHGPGSHPTTERNADDTANPGALAGTSAMNVYFHLNVNNRDAVKFAG